jgi:hypothetical protein
MDVNGKDVIRWGKTNPDVWCDCMTNEIGVENNKNQFHWRKLFALVLEFSSIILLKGCSGVT